MRNELLMKDWEQGNYYTYGMPEMDKFLKLRSDYDFSKEIEANDNCAVLIFFKLFMPCCGTHANYSDKNHQELLSNIYSPSQEGYVLIELMNNYDKWIEKAKELYEKNDKGGDEGNQEVLNQEDKLDHEEKDMTKGGKYTARGTLFTNSKFCVSMDGWSEEGIRKYNKLCNIAEQDRKSETGSAFEKLFKDKEMKKREEKGERVFSEEDFIQPYNNLIYASDDDSSDEDDDDDDQTENENHTTNENVTDRSNRQNELPDHNKFTQV